VREVTEKTPPPRALYMRFPFGHALGEVGQRDQQLDILYRAFELLFEAELPGTIKDSGLRWKRESYPAPDWDKFRQLEPVDRKSK
jgi:D-proline reductase (dithiol) PrdB